jgi:hypothetical protein
MDTPISDTCNRPPPDGFACVLFALEILDMPETIAEQRGRIVKLPEEAEEIAELIGDGATAYYIERALDEARSNQFVPKS